MFMTDDLILYSSKQIKKKEIVYFDSYDSSPPVNVEVPPMNVFHSL